MTTLAQPIVSLLERFQTERLNKNWPAMRAVLHPAARLESLAAPGFVLSAEELIEAIQGATAHGIYTVQAWRVEPLGQRAALADGRVRYGYGAGGFTDERRIWLASELDGLIWRMRVFYDRQQPLGCFGEHGLDLGL